MVLEDDLLKRLGVSTAYFIQDNFMSESQLQSALTGTGSASIRMCDTILSTGVMEGSTARLNYIYSLFNPLYSDLYLQVRLSALSDVLAYFGFLEDLETPTFTMTQSHAGIFVKEGVVYWSTGTGSTYKNTPITQLDPSRDIIYKFSGPSMNWYPTPLAQPYFDGVKVKTELREWSSTYLNGSNIPKDQKHYFAWYISNTTGLTKQMFIKKFTYAEDYRD